MVLHAVVAVLAAATTGGITGQVTEGPTCPVEQAGHPCPPRPYPARVTAGDAATTAGEDGRYRLDVPPGAYTVCASPTSGNGFPRQACRDARVDAGRDTTVDLVMDTGIRGASGGGGGAGPARPHIVQSPIPFPAHRKAEMRAY